MIPDELIDEILGKVDIVEIVSSRIPLKKAGRNFKANCPFHHEKTPSFIVSQDKQIYHCFGCGAGGNALGFLMKHDKYDFREALGMLADMAHVALPRDRFESEKGGGSFLGKLYNANEIAKDFFKSSLSERSADSCSQYLKKRNVNEETVKLFQLGYAPNMWEGLYSVLKNKGVEKDILEKSGLFVPSERDKGFYDRFRNRLIFPIFDIRDKIIGFGARVLDETLPKYINSPETPIYIKGRHLYGHNFSKNFIREKDYAVIVEGYMDLILPFQYGIKNIVATLGTALTEHQVRLLKKLTRTIVMIYDSDKAGEEATLRGLDLLVSLDMNVRIAALPKGFDPDNFIRTYGKDAFEDMINKSKDLFDYKIGILMTRFNKDGVRGKAAIATLMLPTIARIPNEILKAAFLKKLSEVLAIDEASLRAELKKIKIDSYAAGESVISQKIIKFRYAELMLLSIIIDEPDSLSEIDERFLSDEIRNEFIKRIMEHIRTLWKDKKDIAPSKIINHFEDEEAKALVAEACSIRETIKDKDKVLSDCLERIKDDNFREELKNIQSEIRIAQDMKNNEKMTLLISKYNDLLKTHKR